LQLFLLFISNYRDAISAKVKLKVVPVYATEAYSGVLVQLHILLTS